LRRTRLDEIPQLFNVLIGSMSLIGPRPLLPIDQPKTTSFRLQVRPGISGLAQVSGGKLLSAEEKNALDEWYIQKASVLLDVKILFLSALTLVRGDRRNEALVSMALAEK
jgi:lipopolysaccharide/colanic/teichoic acid biosynthesis glycosyltransferase